MTAPISTAGTGAEGRWLFQSRISAPELGIQGNCTQAAVASLFGLDLCDVPDFNTGDNLAWHTGLLSFFVSRGYELLRLDHHRHFAGLYLAGGSTSRGTQHMVVMRGGRIVHDPYPGGFGLTKVERVWVPVPLDPAATAPLPADLIAAERIATPGEWEADKTEAEDGSGRYDGNVMRVDGKTLFDTINGDMQEIHSEYDEDFHRQWDEQGRRDLDFVEKAVRFVRSLTRLALASSASAWPDVGEGDAQPRAVETGEAC